VRPRRCGGPWRPDHHSGHANPDSARTDSDPPDADAVAHSEHEPDAFADAERDRHADAHADVNSDAHSNTHPLADADGSAAAVGRGIMHHRHERRRHDPVEERARHDPELHHPGGHHE
jgi:hypothetical protein